MGHDSCDGISSKSDESAYLTAMCAAFFKRMACAKAVLKVDPEPAFRSLADKIAARASADGIQLEVEVAPRFSIQSIGGAWRAQDAVEGRIRCLRLELEPRVSFGSDSSHGCLAVVDGCLKCTT